MAIQTFLISSFTYKSVAVSGKGLATINEFATLNRHTADSSRTVNLSTVDEKGVTVTIETINNQTINAFDIGDSGALVIKGKMRTNGDGLSTEMTITVPVAMLYDKNTDLPSTNEGNIVLTFDASDPNADDSTASNLITVA